MAFIPDAAVLAGSEVTPHARCLYFVFCAHRDLEGLSDVENAIAMSESGIERRTFFDKRKELELKGWIAIEGRSVRCLKGFNTPPSPEPERETDAPDNDASPAPEKSADPEPPKEKASVKTGGLSLVPSVTPVPPPEPMQKPEPTPEIVQGPVIDDEDEEFQPNAHQDLYVRIFSLFIEDEHYLAKFEKECPNLTILEEAWRDWKRGCDKKNWDPENFRGQIDKYHRYAREDADRKAAAYVGAHQKPVEPKQSATVGMNRPQTRSKYDETPPTDDELLESLHLPTSEDIRRMLILARGQHTDEMNAAPIIEALKQLEYSNWEHWEDGSLPSLTVLSRICGREISRKEVIRAAPDFIRSEPNLPSQALSEQWKKLFKDAQRYLPNIFEMTDEAFKTAIDKTVFMPKAA